MAVSTFPWHYQVTESLVLALGGGWAAWPQNVGMLRYFVGTWHWSVARLGRLTGTVDRNGMWTKKVLTLTYLLELLDGSLG